MVQFDDDAKCYVAVGEKDYNDYIHQKCLAKSVKEVRKVMVRALMEEYENSVLQPRIPKNMIKAVALLSLLPGADGAMVDEIQNAATMNSFWFYDMMSGWIFMTVYTLTVFMAGFAVGFYLRKVLYDRNVRTVVQWATNVVRQIALERVDFNDAGGDQAEEGEEEDAEMDDPQRVFDTVEEWDPDLGRMREYRILDNPSDAESEEEFLKVRSDEAGGDKVIRYYRPNQHVRRATREREIRATDWDERYSDLATDDNLGRTTSTSTFGRTCVREPAGHGAGRPDAAADSQPRRRLEPARRFGESPTSS